MASSDSIQNKRYSDSGRGYEDARCLTGLTDYQKRILQYEKLAYIAKLLSLSQLKVFIILRTSIRYQSQLAGPK
jgi:hypothetical protein